MPGTVLPLGGYPLIQTTSPEAAVAAYSALSSPVALEVRDDDRFSWAANRVIVDRIGVMATHYGAPIRATGTNDDTFNFHVARHGRGAMHTQQHETLELVSGIHGMIVAPHERLVCELAADYVGLMISIPRTTLEATLHALVGDHTPLRFASAVDLTSAIGIGLGRLIEMLVSEADRAGGILEVPTVASSLVDGLLRAVLELPNNHSDELHAPVSAAAPRFLRRAEEYIAAHASGPVTATALADAAGVSVRALQAAFRAHRDSTPTEFLRARRFELARDRLRAGSHTSIADVALACGFSHLGRFSVGYRRQFGESPSETRRRARAG